MLRKGIANASSKYGSSDRPLYINKYKTLA